MLGETERGLVGVGFTSVKVVIARRVVCGGAVQCLASCGARWWGHRFPLTVLSRYGGHLGLWCFWAPARRVGVFEGV